MIVGIVDLELFFCVLLFYCLLFILVLVVSVEIYWVVIGKVDVFFGELLIINRFLYESNL